jgi:hypothetical protein
MQLSDFRFGDFGQLFEVCLSCRFPGTRGGRAYFGKRRRWMRFNIHIFLYNSK